MRPAIIALSLGICLLVTGCGKSSEKVYASKDGNVTVSTSGDSQHMTMNSANGTATVDINSNGGVQATMPAFAPLYPGAKVTSSIVGSNNNGTKGAQVSFTVAASPSDVIAFYKKNIDAAGLPQTLNATEGDSMMLVAGKDKKSVAVTVTKQDNGSQVLVIWGSD
ncbi:MAG: hypothetical protein ABSC92_04045 [Rhizomicrobium sp.]